MRFHLTGPAATLLLATLVVTATGTTATGDNASITATTTTTNKNQVELTPSSVLAHIQQSLAETDASGGYDWLGVPRMEVEELERVILYQQYNKEKAQSTKDDKEDEPERDLQADSPSEDEEEEAEEVEADSGSVSISTSSDEEEEEAEEPPAPTMGFCGGFSRVACANPAHTCKRWGSEIRKRCVPQACLDTEMEAWRAQYDSVQWSNSVLEKAGLTKEDLAAELDIKGRDEFVKSETIVKLMKIIEEDPEPDEAYFAIQRKCFGLSKQSQVSWSGYEIEVTGIASLVLRFLSTTSADEGYVFLSHFSYTCGLDLGFGVFVTRLVGSTTVDRTSHDAIESPYIAADGDIALVQSFGGTAGVHFNGVTFTEYSATPSCLAENSWGIGLAGGVQFGCVYPIFANFC